jgi:hypothetical protein
VKGSIIQERKFINLFLVKYHQQNEEKSESQIWLKGTEMVHYNETIMKSDEVFIFLVNIKFIFFTHLSLGEA